MHGGGDLQLDWLMTSAEAVIRVAISDIFYLADVHSDLCVNRRERNSLKKRNSP